MFLRFRDFAVKNLVSWCLSGKKIAPESSKRMKAIVQRVKKTSVMIDSERAAEIGNGILVFLGITHRDTEKEAVYLVDKIANLRIFEDDKGKMNLSCLEIKGQALVVSQFTLYGDCRKGRRPSYTAAAQPEQAEPLYEYFVKKLRDTGISVQTGKFQAKMAVQLENDGPVTLILDTEERGIL